MKNARFAESSPLTHAMKGPSGEKTTCKLAVKNKKRPAARPAPKL
jgi:hypothetical protein